MAKKSRTSILKRQRELRKAERAAMKRERREERKGEPGASDAQVATQDDLEGYGFPVGDGESDEREDA